MLLDETFLNGITYMCNIQWEVGENQVLVKKTQKHVSCALSLNISYKIHFFFGENILVAL